MATAEQIGIRREAAMARLTAATTSLSARLGTDFGDFPATDRDPLMLDARRIEWTADALEAIAGACADGPATDDLRRKTEAERDAAVSALNAAKQDIEKLTADNAALTDALDAATPPETAGDASKPAAKGAATKKAAG